MLYNLMSVRSLLFPTYDIKRALIILLPNTKPSSLKITSKVITFLK
jgi:hypothetical protein